MGNQSEINCSQNCQTCSVLISADVAWDEQRQVCQIACKTVQSYSPWTEKQYYQPKFFVTEQTNSGWPLCTADLHIPSSASSQLSWGFRGLLGLLKSRLAPKGPCCVPLLCFDSEIPMALLAWASCLCCQVRFCQFEVPKQHSARDHMEEGMKCKKGTGPHSQPSLLELPWSYSPDFSSSGQARWIAHHAAFSETESQAILSAFRYAVFIVAFDSWPYGLTANTTQNYIIFPWGRRSNQLLAAQDRRGKHNTTDLKEKK